MELTDKQILEMIDTHFALVMDESPIYRWVHSQLSKYDDHCENPHEDWREETVQAYKDFVEMGQMKQAR